MESVEAHSDHDLLAAYEQISGERSDPEVDALLAEIERREFNI